MSERDKCCEIAIWSVLLGWCLSMFGWEVGAAVARGGDPVVYCVFLMFLGAFSAARICVLLDSTTP